MTDVVTLDEVRAHLNLPDAFTDDDDMLSSVYIPAVNDVVKREAGDVIPATYDEMHKGGDYVITTRHKPILSVQLIEEDRGFRIDRLIEQQVNTTNPTYYGFSIDFPDSGVISRRALNHPIQFWPGSGECVHIIYQAGRAAVPGNIRLAALQLIALWYRAFQQRQTTADPYAELNEDFPTEGTFTPDQLGVPEWIIELLKPTKRAPIIG